MELSKIIDKIYLLSIAILVCIFWAFLDMPIVFLLSQLLFYGIAVFKILYKKSINREGVPYIQWAFIWILYCLLTTMWSVNFQNTVSYSISVAQVVIVGALMVATIDHRRYVELLEKFIVLAGVVLIIRLAIVTPMSDWGQERLGMEMGMHVNHIATNLLISLMFALKTAVGQRKLIYWLFAIGFIAVLVLTASKKAIIVGLLALLMIAPMGKRGMLQKLKYLLVMLGFLLLLVQLAMEYPFIYELAADRMEGLLGFVNGTGGVDDSTNERQYLLHSAWKVFLEYPLFGVGLDGFRFFNSLNLYAHNNIVEILASCGIVGFIIYYSLYFIIMKRFMAKHKDNVIYGMYFAIVFCIVIMEIMQITYYIESVQFVLVVLFLLTKYGSGKSANIAVLREKMH